MQNSEKNKNTREDKLEYLFRKQRSLMTLYNIQEVDINTTHGQNTIRAITMHLIEELAEVLSYLKNKNWVSYETPVDMKGIEDELADSTHFFIELCILLKISPQKLIKIYDEKYKKNLERIRTQY